MAVLGTPDYDALKVLLAQVGLDSSEVVEGAGVSYRGDHYAFNYQLPDLEPRSVRVTREWADAFIYALRPHGERADPTGKEGGE